MADIAVLIVDDVCLSREGIAAAVARQPAVASVRTAPDLAAARLAVAAAPPDVVLVNLASGAGHEVLRQLRDAAPASRLIALGVTESEDEVVACAEVGVAGYLLRSESLADLLQLIHSVSMEETICSPRMAAALMRRVAALAAERRRGTAPVPVLTTRENQISRLLESGMSNRQIADQLGIEIRTVKNHMHNIMGKLGVQRRGEVVAVYRTARSPIDAR